MVVKVKKISDKRMARIKDLVERLPKELVNGKLRYDVLNELARRHGVGYETIKRELYNLAYAFVPREMYEIQRKGIKTTEELVQLVDIPKSFRPDVKTLRELAEQGVIDPKKARVAAEAFLLHAPWVDIERITRVHGIKDKEVIQKTEEIVKWIKDVYRSRLYGWRAHPAKAYAFAWNLIGRKIHQELENARDLVEKLHPIAGKISRGQKLTKREEEILEELKITDIHQIFDYIDPEKSLTENLKEVYLKVLDHNTKYAEAIHYYEKAKLVHRGLYEYVKDKLDFLGRAPPAGPGSIRSSKVFKLGDKIENAYKNIARWPHSPNVKPRDFPGYFKDLVKKMYKKHYNPATNSFRNFPPGLKGEVTKRLAVIGHYIHQGNILYTELKRKEQEDPILAWIVKTKRKRKTSKKSKTR